MKRYFLTIISANEDGKTYEHGIECEDMVSVVRHMLSFTPKRGYEAINWIVDKVEVLV